MRIHITAEPGTATGPEALSSLAAYLNQECHESDVSLTVHHEEVGRHLSDPVTLVTALLSTSSAAFQLAQALYSWQMQRMGSQRDSQAIRAEIGGRTLTLAELADELERARHAGDDQGDIRGGTASDR
ncbi:hypothetical protein OG900_31950 [Streptomyces sp. NBC_00433]